MEQQQYDFLYKNIRREVSLCMIEAKPKEVLKILEEIIKEIKQLHRYD